MSRSLTASDRASLIRLASTLPAGSAERKAILAGLKKAGGLVKLVLNGGRERTYSAEQIQEMLQAPGVIANMYRNADNLPKWIWEAGASKMLTELMGKLQYVRNPYAKKFPGGGWPLNGNKGWEQVGRILQDILDSGHPVTINVREDDRSANGIR
jgi:hypothetical protein